MKFFGIKERENETNDGTELENSCVRNCRSFQSTKKTFLLTESTEVLHAAHNQMAEVFDRDRL